MPPHTDLPTSLPTIRTTSYDPHTPNQPQITANTSTSLSPSTRHPLTRPISPDLPTRDALYLFSNFSSYMRSPGEGARGIKNSESFKDTVRLLDYARSLVNQPYSNVHILHMKYRFQGQTHSSRSPYTSGDYRLPANYRDSVGRLRNPVPQPFSVLHDPVVKIDYLENGVFEPLPAQAVFAHIARFCQPPPRIIVMAYVSSKVTCNHLSSISTWATTSSPPAYIFSPLECRIREKQPLHLALAHAIPMSMYAYPKSGNTSPSSTISSPGYSSSKLAERPHASASPHTVRKRRVSADDIDLDLDKASITSPNFTTHYHPSDPIATLTVVGSSSLPCASPGSGSTKAEPVIDRIPLWALAPGVGILHGSTSASIGVRLTDFSALNLIDPLPLPEDEERERPDARGRGKITSHEAGIRTSPLDLKGRKTRLLVGGVPPVEPVSRPITPSAVPVPMPGTGDGKGVVGRNGTGVMGRHLTPPERRAPGSGLGFGGGGGGVGSARTQSWPAPVSRVSGWRRGRKEVMEDKMEELGYGWEGVEKVERCGGLVLDEAEGGSGAKGVIPGDREREGASVLYGTMSESGAD